MTTSTSAKQEEPADPLDQTLFYVRNKEAKQLAEALSSLQPPNDALRKLMSSTGADVEIAKVEHASLVMCAAAKLSIARHARSF
jgi:hypothetical protein